MIKHLHYFSSLSIAILFAVVVGFFSCKSQKKISEISGSDEVSQPEKTPIAEPEEAPNVATPESTPKILTKEDQLNGYFGSIASAPSVTSANASIREVLDLFSTPDAPVLIVIYRAGANPDYDEPTTISKYLNYLKDTKNSNARVEEAVYDGNGKIKELVLKKSF